MCGIFGIVSDGKADYQIKSKLRDYIKMACVVGIVRGDDSTGMFQVDQKLKLLQHKLPISGYFFAGDKRAQFLMNRADDALITIGHHRAATIGDISRENCHPFEHYDAKRLLIGVHNGRVWQNKSEEDGKKFEVDSDWLMYRMFRDGAAKTLSEVDGDIATAWYENDGRLRMFSNGKRALHWAVVKGTNAMLIASEHEMIYWCASKANLEIEETFWKPGSDKNLFVFDPSNVREWETVKLPEKPKPEPYKYTPYVRPGLNGPVDENFSRGRDIRQLKHSPRNFTRLDNSRTYQGFAISYEPMAIQKVGLEVGTEVEFLWDIKLRVPAETSNCVGEILVESPTLKDSKGEPELLQNYAMIASASNEDKISIRLADASTTRKGRVVCRVIGVTRLTVSGKEHTCVVLSPPIRYSYGDTSLLSAEDEEAIQGELLKAGVPGPYDKDISPKEYAEKTKDGCAHCGCSLTVQDALKKKVHWEPNSSGGFDAMCSSCAIQFDYVKGTIN